MSPFPGCWFVEVTAIIPETRASLQPPARASPPWGRAFLRLSLLLRSLSFFLFASALHLETLPFRFDSLNCTTFLPKKPCRTARIYGIIRAFQGKEHNSWHSQSATYRSCPVTPQSVSYARRKRTPAIAAALIFPLSAKCGVVSSQKTPPGSENSGNPVNGLSERQMRPHPALPENS